jgi:group I intron endonuclease
MEGLNESGIYMIHSRMNWKKYVGSAVCLRKRFESHRHMMSNNCHHSLILQHHFNKYGANDIEFSVLEYCSKDELIEKEQYWINKLKPEFNVCKTAGKTYPKEKIELKEIRNKKEKLDVDENGLSPYARYELFVKEHADLIEEWKQLGRLHQSWAGKGWRSNKHINEHFISPYND